MFSESTRSYPSILSDYRLGHVLIAGLPGEFTTMAGRYIRMFITHHQGLTMYFSRRMRKSISKVARAFTGDSEVKVVLAGMANVYTHYITTFEEYQVQASHIVLPTCSL